ncbi:hypothetical protein N7540_010283 [Penicillium herquei]|nr:hypothetical protein N7540_010283 [Penicillium herquei]
MAERRPPNLPDPRAGQLPVSPRPRSRVLACVNCQQRKIKCDRKSPCANCLKQRMQCVPATQSRTRKRRFPERELLGRLRRYEELLRQNKIKFDPLHKDENSVEDDMTECRSDTETQEEQDEFNGPSPYRHTRSENSHEPKPKQPTIINGFREATVKFSWDQMYASDDHIILGSRKSSVDLATLHPEPVHIFKLWQLYLDKINPLLKIIHAPTMQGRIIEAAGNTANIEPRLEALMFSIYCMSIQSLTTETCQSTFGLSKEDFIARHQFGCQQALLNCQFLRSDNRDCLTALCLFLYSLQPNTNPRSLSSILGIALQLAQRMGIHSESFLSNCSVFEAEMRRRLWWSLTLFDARLGELSGIKTSSLNPTWDCKIPMNLNDSDLWAEMKEPPVVQAKATESTFIVMRAQIADFIRNSSFHLEFFNPTLKKIARKLPNGGDVATFEKVMEDEFFKFCDEENPLHFMTIWTGRAHISKCYLLEAYAKYIDSSTPPTQAESDALVAHAFRMLDSDTRVINSPRTVGFFWAVRAYFPFPAYFHIIHDLKKRPISHHSNQAWEVMNANYEARFTCSEGYDYPLFAIFSNVILQAWEALEEAIKRSGEPLAPPKIVVAIKQRLLEMTPNAPTPSNEQSEGTLNTLLDQPLMPMEFGLGLGNDAFFSGIGGQSDFLGPDPRLFTNMQPPLTSDMNHLNWMSMFWGMREGRGW